MIYKATRSSKLIGYFSLLVGCLVSFVNRLASWLAGYLLDEGPKVELIELVAEYGHKPQFSHQ